MEITRRSFGLAAAGAALLPALPVIPAAAKEAPAGAQVAGVYRLKVGNYEITVLNDGWAPLKTELWSGDPAGAEKLLHAAYQPTGMTDIQPTAVNEWLINTGDKLILVDTGTSNVFAPSLGRLPKSLAAAGVNPADIDAVVITHIHPDHASGLLTTDKKIAFPNATVHVNGEEFAWWTEGDIKVPDAKPFWKDFAMLGRAAFKPYADAGKVKTFKDGSEIAPGITTISAPGHTVGHTMVRLAPTGGQLLLWTDIVHNATLQFPEPDRAIAFDLDTAMAIATRKKVMDMAATDRLMIAGTHLPFPGIGHVAKAGTGYAYLPIAWNTDL
jgi:glyoxylase-like metal-dependent hydrolase (beta-lactamase superfamily II)